MSGPRKTAIVTGASQGIGAGIVKAFVERGFNVVGKDRDVKAGRTATFTAALNALALAKKQLGSLDRVSRRVRLGVYVAATPDFIDHAKVADAASELLRDVLGEETISSRVVIGVASLPLGSPVELEVILEVKTV